MLQGGVVTDGWQSREVFDALDLCLACKGCTSDCPVGVDMPAYKSEFLYHHYQSPRRWRPRYAYAFGYIDKAARLASLVPKLANVATQTPGLRRLAKLAAGIDKRRPLPTFAPMTLQDWFQGRDTVNGSGRPVVLFPDTFNNYLHTDVGVACIEALEAAGWRVIMPARHVCCGRPLYDYGFLDSAGRYLRRVLDELRPYVREDIPVAGMEPSCLAVFKDELRRMLPHDDDAARLARNAYHFGEFFKSFGVKPPRIEGSALLWGHCHHRATGGMTAEKDVLEQAGLSVQEIKGGCCGLAGSWGFEDGKCAISMGCGEQALLPTVRDAPDGILIVADGFSYQTQIADAHTGKRALHTGQVLAMGRAGESGDGDSRRPAPAASRRAARTAAAALPVVAGLAAAARAASRTASRR
jgi:Fe-S oxidoreductase